MTAEVFRNDKTLPSRACIRNVPSRTESKIGGSPIRVGTASPRSRLTNIGSSNEKLPVISVTRIMPVTGTAHHGREKCGHADDRKGRRFRADDWEPVVANDCEGQAHLSPSTSSGANRPPGVRAAYDIAPSPNRNRNTSASHCSVSFPTSVSCVRCVSTADEVGVEPGDQADDRSDQGGPQVHRPAIEAVRSRREHQDRPVVGDAQQPGEDAQRQIEHARGKAGVG